VRPNPNLSGKSWLISRGVGGGWKKKKAHNIDRRQFKIGKKKNPEKQNHQEEEVRWGVEE